MPWNDTNELVGIIGIVVGLVGIIVSLVLYFRSKTKKIMEYKIISTRLITESIASIPNLKVTIDNQPVKSLSSTTIEFFNCGNQSIILSDYAIMEPLCITITGRLHSYDVSADNFNSTPALHPIDDTTFCVKFDFLKPNQSFSIKLFHDGKVNVLGELTSGNQREHRESSSTFLWIIVSVFFNIILNIGYIIGVSGILPNGQILTIVRLSLPTVAIILVVFISSLVHGHVSKKKK